MRTFAKVTLTVEIELNTTWEATCSVAQVYEQAAEEAVGMVRDKLHSATVVGTPNVVTVTNKQEYGDVPKAGAK